MEQDEKAAKENGSSTNNDTSKSASNSTNVPETKDAKETTKDKLKELKEKMNNDLKTTIAYYK